MPLAAQGYTWPPNSARPTYCELCSGRGSRACPLGTTKAGRRLFNGGVVSTPPCRAAAPRLRRTGRRVIAVARRAQRGGRIRPVAVGARVCQDGAVGWDQLSHIHGAWCTIRAALQRAYVLFANSDASSSADCDGDEEGGLRASMKTLLPTSCASTFTTRQQRKPCVVGTSLCCVGYSSGSLHSALPPASHWVHPDSGRTLLHVAFDSRRSLTTLPTIITAKRFDATMLRLEDAAGCTPFELCLAPRLALSDADVIGLLRSSTVGQLKEAPVRFACRGDRGASVAGRWPPTRLVDNSSCGGIPREVGFKRQPAKASR